jgi:hypothetical protein
MNSMEGPQGSDGGARLLAAARTRTRASASDELTQDLIDLLK